MGMLIAAFVAAFAVTLAVARSAKRLEGLAGDHDLSGPQKFHARPVPRIGGVGIVVGVAAGAGLGVWLGQPSTGLATGLLIAALPTFVSGVAEDLTKSQSPRRRMAFTAVSAALAVWLVSGVINRTDIPGLDWVVGFASGAAVVTVFVVTGVANAVNIIDGFNGLSPMFPLVSCIYPVFETLFSIYRRKLLRGMPPGMPDGVHLRMLVFKRLMRWAVGNRDAHALTHRISMTSPYLWILCSLSVVPAVLFYDSTSIQATCIELFAFTYLILYWRIVRFKAPRWMVFSPSKPRREG